MSSLVLRTATRLLLPLLLLFSIYLLLNGHNEPGGGFVGGSIAATAFILYHFAHGLERAQGIVRLQLRVVMAAGLSVIAVSAIVPLLGGKPLLTGLWLEQELPLIGKLGTPLLFDLGVYLVVVGISLLIIFTLAEE